MKRTNRVRVRVGLRLFTCFTAFVFVLTPAAPSRAVIPVFDSGNFAQNVVTAIEAVDQTLTQVLQYKNQLLQYEEMVRNGAAPAVYTWDRINSIKSKLQTITSSLHDYRHWLQDLEDYLRRFRDLDYYRSATCYGSNLNCPESEWRRSLSDSQDLRGLASESQKRTLDQLMRALDASDDELDKESTNLEKLQQQAQAARGHMEALQAGNQLASAEVQQLMQMRAVMIDEYRATAVQGLAHETLEAQQQAASERYRRSMVEDSAKVRWPVWPKEEGL